MLGRRKQSDPEGPVAFEERFRPYLLGRDPQKTWQFLTSLEGDLLKEAKAWFGKSQTRVVDALWQERTEWFRPGARNEDLRDAPWQLALGPVALLGPATAAQKIGWRRLWIGWWAPKDDPGYAFLIARLLEKDRDWIAAFVETLAGIRAGDNDTGVARVVRVLAEYHRLPCPTGATFVQHWTAGVPEMERSWTPPHQPNDPLAWLLRDPFMPDLLLHHLASGECGSSDWLPGVLPALVEKGVVDRDVVVQHTLVQLTAAQRPASQKVLAEILSALDLTAGEVPGACTYFTGVIATSKGVVGKLFLPMALQTVESPEDLAELVATIAARTEKAQKNVLLTALKGDDLRTRVGLEPVREALDLLAAGDDAAFTTKVRAVLDRLPGAAPVVEEPLLASGLWDLEPMPSGEKHDTWWGSAREADWNIVLDSSMGTWDSPRLRKIDTVLTEMRDGTFDADRNLGELCEMLTGARLSVSLTIGVFRDLFFAGGLRQGFPVVLGLADFAAGMSKRPAAVADLIRFVCEFVPEVPEAERPRLPARLHALTHGKATTKAQAEARVLGARLAGVSVEEFVAGLEPALPADTLVVHRGLWQEPDEFDLGSVRIQPPDSAMLEKLADPSIWMRAGEDLTGSPSNLEPLDLPPGAAFNAPDLWLWAVAGSVGARGPKEFRTYFRALREGPVYGGRPADQLAYLLWAQEEPSPARYWQLALKARVASSIDGTLRRGSDQGADHQKAFEALYNRWRALAWDRKGPHGMPDGPVFSIALNAPTARLLFFRVLEAMLLAPRNPIVLATPTWADGTLELRSLARRLQAAEGKPIGPLDLVQALHRLRPWNADDLTELDALAASGGSFRTAPELTTPQGKESWDALALVRTWVDAGGLPEVDVVRDEDGAWATSTRTPVPWSLCAAAPEEVRADLWQLDDFSGLAGVARIFPLWPDRSVLRGHYAQRGGSFRARQSGVFGLPMHDAFVGLMAVGIEHRDAASLQSCRTAVRLGRVRPSSYVEAALARLDAGELKLGRIAQATAWLFEQGGLSRFWEPSLALVDALCARPGKPAVNAGQLIDVLVSVAHEVPDPVVPACLRTVAASNGKAKFHQSARALVAALENGAGR